MPAVTENDWFIPEFGPDCTTDCNPLNANCVLIYVEFQSPQPLGGVVLLVADGASKSGFPIRFAPTPEVATPD